MPAFVIVGDMFRQLLHVLRVLTAKPAIDVPLDPTIAQPAAQPLDTVKVTKTDNSQLPDYMASFNLDIRQIGPRWFVANVDYGFSTSHEDVEVAILMMWRYLKRYGDTALRMAK